MYPLVEEVQNRKEYSPYLGRLAPSCPTPQRVELKEESHAVSGEEDDLRIMQHFVANMIERP